MPIPTEPIGSVPRPREPHRSDAAASTRDSVSRADLDAQYEAALRDSIARFEATGSPVITDGEQTKPSFATYPIHGLQTLAPDGVVIPFADGHTRQLPRLTPGRSGISATPARYVEAARRYARVPVKQAVISASALSLLYPADGIDGYSREAFLDDLVREAETDIRSALDAGAHNVQVDFTEGRLAHQARSVVRRARSVHRAQQRRPRSLLTRRAVAARRAHVSGRRPRLDSQRRRRLCGADSAAVRAARQQLLSAARQRARSPRASSRSSRAISSRVSASSSASPIRSPAKWRPGGGARPRARGGRDHPARAARHHRRLRLLARLPTMCRRRGRRRLRRFARAWSARRSPLTRSRRERRDGCDRA